MNTMFALKNWFGPESSHKYFLCVIFVVALLNIVVRLNFLPLTFGGDAPSYIGSAQFLGGDETAKAHPGRLLKPLALLGIVLLTPLFGGNIVAGFLALNIIAYIFLVFAIYALLLLFTTDRFLVMLGTLMFISAYPLLSYGLDLYSDMGAWALFILAVVWTVRYYRDASWKNFNIALLAIVIGLSWKEYAVPAGIFFGLIILFEQTCTWKQKFLRIGLLALGSALVLGFVQWLIHAQFHYTYVDYLREASATSPEQSQHNLYFMVKSLFGVFLLGWGLVFAGLWHWRSLSRPDQWTIALLLPPSLLCLLWTFVSSRLYFIVAPFLAILALHGLRSLTDRRLVQIALTVIVISGSYAWLFASGSLRVLLQ